MLFINIYLFMYIYLFILFIYGCELDAIMHSIDKIFAALKFYKNYEKEFSSFSNKKVIIMCSS